MEGKNGGEAERKGKSNHVHVHIAIYTTSHMAATGLFPPPTLPVSLAVRWSMQGTG